MTNDHRPEWQHHCELIHRHPHMHAIVPEGIFTDSGYFVYITRIWRHRAMEFWQKRRGGCLLLDEMKINKTVAASMRG